MKKLIIISSLAISICALGLSLVSFLERKPNTSVQLNHNEENELFRKKLLAQVKASVEFNKEIPHKDEVLSVIERLEKDFTFQQEGDDNLRFKFVSCQGTFEHVLACFQALGDIVELVGVIHTPLPPTPLCTLPDPIDMDVLDESIRFDTEKLLTVRSRAQLVREYLINGGKLYAVYPEGGLQKRTTPQQAIYKEEVSHFTGQLMDWVLKTADFEPDMTGATYLLKNQKNQFFAFSIKSKQAIDTKDVSEWGLWFGPINHPLIESRINSVFDYLKAHDGPDLRSELL